MARACAAPAWELNPATDLAAEFVEQDGGSSSDANLVNVAASSLWLIAVEVCPDFPDAELENGPFNLREP